MLGLANYMAVLFCHCDERSIFHENQEISFPAALGGYGVQLLTATAFAAAPAEEENGFFDFLLGKKYTYLYAALTWDEYWTNEKVYAAGSTAASAQLDSHEEQDLGAFDAVSRATVNHGLHRGSFQSTAVIYAKDGSSYTVSHWSDDGKTIYLADGTTVGWNRGTITKADGSTVQMDHYEVLGTKYVPVRVATSDLADFCSKYTVWKTAASWWAATLKRT